MLPKVLLALPIIESRYIKRLVCRLVVTYRLRSWAPFSSHFFLFWGDSPQWARASSFKRFLGHTQRRATVGRTPLDEWSARRRDLYLTTHNTHNRQTSMLPVGFEPTIPASEPPQTHALDRAATGIGTWSNKYKKRNHTFLTSYCAVWHTILDFMFIHCKSKFVTAYANSSLRDCDSMFLRNFCNYLPVWTAS